MDLNSSRRVPCSAASLPTSFTKSCTASPRSKLAGTSFPAHAQIHILHLEWLRFSEDDYGRLFSRVPGFDSLLALNCAAGAKPRPRQEKCSQEKSCGSSDCEAERGRRPEVHRRFREATLRPCR